MHIGRYIFFLLFTCSVVLGKPSQRVQLHYTGDMRTDLLMNDFSKDTLELNRNIAGKRSPYIAAAASAILPGAGQAYVGNWWMAAGFFVAEVAGVTAALHYTNMGYQQTVFFQNYADWNISSAPGDFTARWDVVKYAEWINNYIAQNMGDKTPIFIDPDQSKPPWDRVNWTELNAKELEIENANSSSGFSHTLPAHGQQSYYEEIGKYPQFGHGWDDADPNFAGTELVTNHLTYYAGQRNEVNLLYGTATFATAVVILNHIASAIDAVFLTESYNRSLAFNLGTEVRPDGTLGFVPKMTLTVGF